MRNISKNKPHFLLPLRGILESNGPNDPLDYYYHRIVGFLYRARIEQALSLLNPPYTSILEIGYGSGILMPSLVSVGKNIYGIDVCSEPEKVMHNLNTIGVKAVLKRGDICEGKYPSEFFDLVVAISVVEHEPRVEALLDNVFSILKPGGYFLVGMPQVSALMELAFHFLGYHSSKAQHVINHQRFLAIAQESFNLEKFIHLPSRVPRLAGIYFNMLFCKKRKSRI